MKLYCYDTIDELNEALAKFEVQRVPIAKVKLLTMNNLPYYYVLTDETQVYQQIENKG